MPLPSLSLFPVPRAVLVSTTLLAVMVSAAMVSPAAVTPAVAVLEIEVFSSPTDAECQDIQKARAILLEISRTEFVVGEEGECPYREHDVHRLAARLTNYKRARPDRTETILRVHDDATYTQITGVLDMLKALDLPASSLSIVRPLQFSECLRAFH